MQRFLHRTRFQLRWRLYARMALVCCLALILIGGVGWWGARRTARQTQHEAQAFRGEGELHQKVEIEGVPGVP